MARAVVNTLRRARQWLLAILPVTPWPAAATVWLTHVNGLLRSETVSVLAFVWLLAAGCLGAPVGALRLLGKHLIKPVCYCIAAFCVALAALLTYLYASGTLHPTLAALVASLLATMTPAIHAYNVGRWLERTRSAYQKGIRDGRALESENYERGERLMQDLARGKNADELAAWIEVLRNLHAGVQAREREQVAAQRPADPGRPYIVREDGRRAGHG